MKWFAFFTRNSYCNDQAVQSPFELFYFFAIPSVLKSDML